MAPAAAPARVTLAFLCFLMVLNNLNGLLGRLPPLLTPDSQSGNKRVWMSDFLFGTMIFNFVPLIECALLGVDSNRCHASRTAMAMGDGSSGLWPACTNTVHAACARWPRAGGDRSVALPSWQTQPSTMA